MAPVIVVDAQLFVHGEAGTARQNFPGQRCAEQPGALSRPAFNARIHRQISSLTASPLRLLQPG